MRASGGPNLLKEVWWKCLMTRMDFNTLFFWKEVQESKENFSIKSY